MCEQTFDWSTVFLNEGPVVGFVRQQGEFSERALEIYQETEMVAKKTAKKATRKATAKKATRKATAKKAGAKKATRKAKAKKATRKATAKKAG